jgi:alpha-tubulin suppressor-like RCC1 family protein
MPIPSLRGIGVETVIAGVDMCFAITHEHDVYVWGGGGFGRTGIIAPKNFKKKSNNSNEGEYRNPQIIVDMVGEECSVVSVGLSHCIALGRGGDCFVWGENDVGQLGMSDFEARPNVTIHSFFPALAQVSCGANHNAALYPNGEVYVWGHASNGRLGIGAVERLGVLESERKYWPVPQHIKTLEPIRQISCGADHTLAYGSSGVWAWGSGAGGKLGLGDTKDRFDPCIIPKLRGKFIMQLVAGTWHSMALVAYPPMLKGGWISTWGSGYHGQLAQGSKQVSLIPEVIDYFVNFHILCKSISAGSHHCAAITVDGELYTWGSNTNGCLGRKIGETDVLYTAIPGYVSGFGAIVGKTGRGLPRSVTCGKEFTVVATYPYTGPDLLVASKLMEEAKIREQEVMLAKKTEQQFHEEISG